MNSRQRVSVGKRSDPASSATALLIDRSTTLRIEKIKLNHATDNRASLAREWDILSESLPQQSPMASYSWIEPYCEVFLTNGQEGEAYLVYDGSKLVGVFPVIVTQGKIDGKILKTPFNEHTIAGDIVLADGYERKGIW